MMELTRSAYRPRGPGRCCSAAPPSPRSAPRRLAGPAAGTPAIAEPARRRAARRPSWPYLALRREPADGGLPGPQHPRLAGPVQRIGQASGQRVRPVAGVVVPGPGGAAAAQPEGVGGPVHRDAVEQGDCPCWHGSLPDVYGYIVLIQGTLYS